MSSDTSHIEVITELKRCKEVVSLLSEHDVVAIDLEGKSLGAQGIISLVQMAVNKDKVFIFDIVRDRRMMCSGGIKDILEDLHIVKVFHACSCDCGNIYHEYGITVKSIFDTQVAHGLIQQHSGKEVAFNLRGLNAILEHCGAPINDHKDFMKKQYRRDNGFWLRRPLSERALLYAAADVISLVPQVYDKLKQKAVELNILEKIAKQSDEQALIQAKPQQYQDTKRDREQLRQMEILQDLEAQLESGAKLCFTKLERCTLGKINPRSGYLSANSKKVLELFALNEMEQIISKEGKDENSYTLVDVNTWMRMVTNLLEHPCTTVRERAAATRIEIQKMRLRFLSLEFHNGKTIINRDVESILELSGDRTLCDHEDFGPLRTFAVQRMVQMVCKGSQFKPDNLYCGLDVVHARMIMRLTSQEADGTPVEDFYKALEPRRDAILGTADGYKAPGTPSSKRKKRRKQRQWLDRSRPEVVTQEETTQSTQLSANAAEHQSGAAEKSNAVAEEQHNSEPCASKNDWQQLKEEPDLQESIDDPKRARIQSAPVSLAPHAPLAAPRTGPVRPTASHRNPPYVARPCPPRCGPQYPPGAREPLHFRPRYSAPRFRSSDYHVELAPRNEYNRPAMPNSYRYQQPYSHAHDNNQMFYDDEVLHSSFMDFNNPNY